MREAVAGWPVLLRLALRRDRWLLSSWVLGLALMAGFSAAATVDLYPTEQSRVEAAATINASGADTVVIGTPIDLRRVVDFALPAVRVRYDLQEIGTPTLHDVLSERGFL